MVGHRDLALLSRNLVMERKTPACAPLPRWTVTVGESPCRALSSALVDQAKKTSGSLKGKYNLDQQRQEQDFLDRESRDQIVQIMVNK